MAAALLLYFVGRELNQQWQTFRSTPLQIRPQWLDIIGSGVLVLFTYALLVQTWRLLLGAWGARLSFWGAARIWTVSNLWRYVPGKIWQIGAMGTMASQQNVSPIAAANAALIGTVVNIAAGIAIALALAWKTLERIGPGARAAAIVLEIFAAVALLALPYFVPTVGRILGRLTGRGQELQLESPNRRAIGLAVIGNVAAWVLYGIAFMWLVSGVLGTAVGSTAQYVAIYAASYVVGYLFLILPGGIGPREAVMVLMLTTFALATPKEAWLIAGASRVWLTVLEIVPGLVFLALSGSRETDTVAGNP